MRTTLTALVDGFTPRLPTEDETDRARFLVQTWLLGTLACLAFLPLNLWSGMWWQLGLASGVCSAGALILLLLRNPKRLFLATQISLATFSLAFATSTLMQTPPDVSNLLALVLVPLMASYLMTRYSFVWVVLAAATGGLTLWLGARGISAPVVDPRPMLSGVFNVVITLFCCWVLSHRFDRLRRDALERMRQADRAKTIFLGTVGHEIRTPMNGVLGMTEVMLQEPQSPLQREQLEVIQRSGRGLVSLINDLLDLTKLEAKKLVVEAVPFELIRELKDLEVLVRPLAAARHLALTVECAADVPPVVRVDGQRLTQVLTNLLNNAVKFTERGRVRLSVTREGGRLRFEVMDTGVGIDAQVLPRLFVPFEQADGSSTRRYGGTGLGLAISRQLVELMGGRLEVKSTPGQGSTFWFTLACEVAQLAPAPLPSPPRLEPSSRRVLVVDDNAINLRVAVSLVEKAGFQAVGASSGPAALEVARQEELALVLMDCHMPGMDGFEATAHLRALPRGADLPVVALTASATPDDVEACLRSGMNEVLAKPIRLETLREVLSRRLGEVSLAVRAEPAGPGAEHRVAVDADPPRAPAASPAR